MAAVEYAELENAEKIKSEKDHHKSRGDIHKCLIFCKEAAERSRKRTEKHEHSGESKHESQRVRKGLDGFALLLAARKVGYVYRQHGQKAG